MAAKRVFIAFAIEDARYRNFLKGQELNTGSPIDYIDMSVKDPWSEDWKARCRARIKGCDGVIALLSRNSLSASGQRFEIRCAKEELVPLVGVYISPSDRSAPPETYRVRKVAWTWDGIAAFIKDLPDPGRPIRRRGRAAPEGRGRGGMRVRAARQRQVLAPCRAQ